MYVVILDKYRATWAWTVKNPEGGSFGSNNCGSKRGTLYTALRGVPSGAPYQVITNGKAGPVAVRS